MKWIMTLKIRISTPADFAPGITPGHRRIAYYEIDKRRPLSFEEIKSDLVLSNGARFYNDHAHPEYSTPECTTLREIVAQDKAGERILAECARRRNLKLPPGYESAFTRTTRFAGHSYGCHDNYLMSRDIPWDRIVAGVLPFLVTRQIFCGAGKMGIEGESSQGIRESIRFRNAPNFFSVGGEHRHDESSSPDQHAR